MDSNEGKDHADESRYNQPPAVDPDRTCQEELGLVSLLFCTPFFQSQIEPKSKRDPPWPTPFIAAPGQGVVKVEVAGHVGTKVLGHMVRHVGLSRGNFSQRPPTDSSLQDIGISGISDQ